MIVKANEGKTFRRIIDGFMIGNTINLGIDYSTGIEREDTIEYYEEIDIPKEDEDYDRNIF